MTERLKQLQFAKVIRRYCKTDNLKNGLLLLMAAYRDDDNADIIIGDWSRKIILHLADSSRESYIANQLVIMKFDAPYKKKPVGEILAKGKLTIDILHLAGLLAKNQNGEFIYDAGNYCGELYYDYDLYYYSNFNDDDGFYLIEYNNTEYISHYLEVADDISCKLRYEELNHRKCI